MIIRRMSMRATGALALGLGIWVAACSSEAPGAPGKESSPSESSGSSKEALQADPQTAPAHFPGVALPGAMKNGAHNTTGCGGQLLYHGGPVLQNVKVYSVFWTSRIDPNVTAQIGNFYTDVLASSYLDWLSEYDTVGVVPLDMGTSTNQGISRGQYMGATTITPSVCSGTTACTVTDTQIQAELVAQWNAGHLTKPTKGCDGQTDSIYMIEFPSNVTISLTIGGGTSFSCTSFCAYHYDTTYMGQYVPYGVHPDMEAGPCANACSTAPPAKFTDVTSVHSHELVEAITDADVTITGGAYARPSAWGSAGCGEIGDECNFMESPITTDNGHTWTVQQEWSNLQNTCTTSGTPKSVCTGTNTPPGCRACLCSDNQYTGKTTALGCDGALPWCETDAANVKHGDCVQCTNNAECTTVSTYCEKSSTPSSDDICAPCGAAGQTCCPTGTPCVAPNTCGGGGMMNVCGCTPITSCPMGENCGTVPDGCGGTLNCGTCTMPNTCGGGGMMNVCGCTPKTTCPTGDNCGMVSDGCTGMVNCGTCTTPDTCGGGGTMNVCGCTPKTACPTGDDCGMVSDGCTGMLNCGSCTSPKTCGGGGTPNHCGCTPMTMCPSPDNCGSIADGCGGMVSCGTCSGGQTCVSNVCTTTGTDAGGGDAAMGPDSSSGNDASSGPDSSSGGDSSSGTDGSGDDGGGGGTGDTGGCGCRTAPSATNAPAVLALGGLLVASFLRRRRRRAA